MSHPIFSLASLKLHQLPRMVLTWAPQRPKVQIRHSGKDPTMIYFCKMKKYNHLLNLVYIFPPPLFSTDYVTWNGPDPDLRKGNNKQIARGPNPNLRSGPRTGAKGPNLAIRRGPAGIAKGSIYGSLQEIEDKCTSRGS